MVGKPQPAPCQLFRGQKGLTEARMALDACQVTTRERALRAS
jgi:hypothetical protein